MANALDILTRKGRNVLSTSPAATVLKAAQHMNDYKIGCLAVLDDGRLVGILSERDILTRVVAQRRDPASTLVEEVMTTDVICCQEHTMQEEARGVMKNRRIRHLPVLDGDGNLVGLISIGDLNAFQATSQEQTIHLLREYIYGYV
jgi:CBS domain-containing protein